MKLRHLFYYLLIIFPLLVSCNQPPGNPRLSGIEMKLSADSTAVELAGIPDHVIDLLQADSLHEDIWKDFFAVYRDTSDAEMRDFLDPVPGSYYIRDGLIVFEPVPSLGRGSFFARCYIRNLLEEPGDIIFQEGLPSAGSFLEYRFVMP